MRAVGVAARLPRISGEHRTPQQPIIPVEGEVPRRSQRQHPSSIILSVSKERCGGEAAASKDEGCGLGAEYAADASRLCPSVKAPQHEGGGRGISLTGGEIGQTNAPHSIRSSRDGRLPSASRSPHLRGRCPAGQRGVSPTLRPQNAPPKHLNRKYFQAELIT